MWLMHVFGMHKWMNSTYTPMWNVEEQSPNRLLQAYPDIDLFQ